MEPIIISLTIIASAATILGFVYVIVFGNRNLVDLISNYKKRENNKKVEQLKDKKPVQAYETYVRLSHEAQVGLNPRLSKSVRDTLLKLYDSNTAEFNDAGITKEFIDAVTLIENIKNKLYDLREYDDVVKLSRSVLNNTPFDKDQQDYRFRVLKNEVKTYYGQALMYLGDSSAAKQQFSEVILSLENDEPPRLARQKEHSLFGRRNLALGKAHSNLGYWYRKQGVYELARREFSSALPYFIVSEQKEEVANTCDNIGRVSSLMGERAKARIFIEHGLQLRQELENPSRIGLSINSSS